MTAARELLQQLEECGVAADVIDRIAALLDESLGIAEQLSAFAAKPLGSHSLAELTALSALSDRAQEIHSATVAELAACMSDTPRSGDTVH